LFLHFTKLEKINDINKFIYFYLPIRDNYNFGGRDGANEGVSEGVSEGVKFKQRTANGV
jgi:hypothetical protein